MQTDKCWRWTVFSSPADMCRNNPWSHRKCGAVHSYITGSGWSFWWLLVICRKTHACMFWSKFSLRFSKTAVWTSSVCMMLHYSLIGSLGDTTSGTSGSTTLDGSASSDSSGPLSLGVVPDQTAEVAKPFGFQVPEGVTTDTGVSFTASLADGSPLPSWLKFDTKQMSFTGTPSQETELGISLKGTHASSGRSAKTGFLLKVGSGGFKPFIAGHLPGITATAGQLFKESIPRSVISDPDGDILAFSLSSEAGKLPDWLHFDPNLMIVSGVPDKEQKLELSVTGRDTDGHSASTPLQLRVQESALDRWLQHCAFCLGTAAGAAVGQSQDLNRAYDLFLFLAILWCFPSPGVPNMDRTN